VCVCGERGIVSGDCLDVSLFCLCTSFGSYLCCSVSFMCSFYVSTLSCIAFLLAGLYGNACVGAGCWAIKARKAAVRPAHRSLWISAQCVACINDETPSTSVRYQQQRDWNEQIVHPSQEGFSRQRNNFEDVVPAAALIPFYHRFSF